MAALQTWFLAHVGPHSVTDTVSAQVGEGLACFYGNDCYTGKSLPGDSQYSRWSSVDTGLSRAVEGASTWNPQVHRFLALDPTRS